MEGNGSDMFPGCSRCVLERKFMKNKRSRITSYISDYARYTTLEGRDYPKEFGLNATVWRSKNKGRITFSNMCIKMFGAEMHLTYRQMKTLWRFLNKHFEDRS